MYSIGQLLGGYLGYGLLRALVPQEGDSRDNFCVSKPGPGVTPARAFLGEFIISAVLILVCCGVWDPRNSKHHGKYQPSSVASSLTVVDPFRFGTTQIRFDHHNTRACWGKFHNSLPENQF